MRMPQYIGLNDWANRLISRKQKVREEGVRIFASGARKQFKRWRRVPLARIEDAGVIRGIGGSSHIAKLHRYTFPNGEQFVEYVQTVVHSGGPCYLVALKDKSGKPVAESLWTEDQMHEV